MQRCFKNVFVFPQHPETIYCTPDKYCLWNWPSHCLQEGYIHALCFKKWLFTPILLRYTGESEECQSSPATTLPITYQIINPSILGFHQFQWKCSCLKCELFLYRNHLTFCILPVICSILLFGCYYWFLHWVIWQILCVRFPTYTMQMIYI